MTQCRVRWAPSIHRDRHGEKNDHALVESLWTWRIKTVKQPPAKDFQALLKETRDDQGNICPNPARVAFTEAVKQKLSELDHSGDLDAETQHRYLCEAITHAIDTTLPDKAKSAGPQRKVLLPPTTSVPTPPTITITSH